MKRPVSGALLFCAMVALMVVVGCSKSEQADKTSDKSQPGAAAAGQDPAVASEGAAPVLSQNVAKRPSLEGRWVLLFYQRLSGTEVPAALVDIKKSAKGLEVKVPQFGAALGSPTLKLAQANPAMVHLVLEMAVQTVAQGQAPVQQLKQADIIIEFHDGYARGSAQFTPLDSFLVAMVPTQVETIQELHPQPLPESAELNPDKNKKDDFIEKAVAFLKAHPDSPLTVELFPVMFATAPERKLDKAAVDALADRYVAAAQRWGGRAALKAHIEIASALIKNNYLPKIALHQLDLALAQLTEETIPVWKLTLEQMKDTAIANEALLLVRKGTPEEKTKSVQLLRDRDRKQPFDPIVLSELARYDDEHGKKDEALREYAKLAVLPLFDQILQQLHKDHDHEHEHAHEHDDQYIAPRETAEKLWKAAHGGKADGFDKYLDDVYAQSMPKYTEKPVDPRPADPENRVVLCELFTGASCGYCVAADVAFAQLIKTYAPSEMVALQYHEHIPQPDPLTNQDSEARFRFYFPDRGGTPTFAINGMPAQRGGMLHQATDVYAGIRSAIDHFLTRKTSVRINLKAEPKGSVVAVTAEADGSFPPNDPIRLRLALAEDRINLQGSNGIREHEMVVRAMPGGPQGIEMKDGKLQFHGTIDLKSIRQELNDQLIADEEKQKMKFPSKPLELSHLRLVAFVQNDQSHEVYQAKMIPFPTTTAPKAVQTQPAPAAPHPAAVARSGNKP